MGCSTTKVKQVPEKANSETWLLATKGSRKELKLDSAPALDRGVQRENSKKRIDATMGLKRNTNQDVIVKKDQLEDASDDDVMVPLAINRSPTKRNSLVSLTSKHRNSLVRLASNQETENPESWPPFQEPNKMLEEALQRLAQEDWECKCEGLTTIRRLAVHHENVLVGTQLHVVTLAIVEETRNLRSQVSQSAILCLGDLFNHMKKNMDVDLDMTVIALLNKSGDSNKFIRETAEKSLNCMLGNVTAGRALISLINVGLSHRNGAVRNTTARLLSSLVEIIGTERILREFADRLLPAAAQLVMDGSQETRYSGQKILYDLIFSSSPDELNRAMNKHVSPTVMRNIQDKLETLKKRGLGGPPSGMSMSRRISFNTKTAFAASVRRDDSRQTLDLPSAPPSSSSAVSKKRSTKVDDTSMAELQSIEMKLVASDWRERLTGVEQLADLVDSRPAVVSAHINRVFGKFIPCLRDPNSKVNVAALLAMDRMTSALAAGMSNLLGRTVETIVPNLASSNSESHAAAEQVLDTLVEHIDSMQLLQPIIGEAQKSKQNVKADLVDRITFMVANIHSVRPSYAASHGLSFLWHLLGHLVTNSSTNTRLREATIDYVMTLHSLLGSELLAAANGNSAVTRPMYVLLSDMLQVV